MLIKLADKTADKTGREAVLMTVIKSNNRHRSFVSKLGDKCAADFRKMRDKKVGLHYNDNVTQSFIHFCLVFFVLFASSEEKVLRATFNNLIFIFAQQLAYLCR